LCRGNPPWAHIDSGTGYTLGEYALCGASIYPSDFAFKDIEHAKKHYAAGKYLRACQACLDEAERRK